MCHNLIWNGLIRNKARKGTKTIAEAWTEIDAIINNKDNSIIQENNIKYEHSN